MSKNNENTLVPRLRFPEFVKEVEWEEEDLGTLAENLDSKRVPITSNQREKGTIPYYGASGIIDYVKEYIYNENLLCISEDGANLIDRNYPIAFSISGKTWVNNHAHVLKFENIHTQLLVEKYINSINVEDFLTGMAQPKLNRGKLDIIPIPLPKNPNEQQKIASCLSSLDEVIKAESQKLGVVKEHKKGLLQNLFPQNGETVPMLRFKEFEDGGAWEKNTMEEICKITSGGTPSRTVNDYWNGEIPWISTTLIDFNTINAVNEYITEAGLQNSSAKIFPKNTILMAMYGQGKTRGKVAILGIEAATNQACAAILLKEGFNTNFVFQNLAGRYEEIRELSNQGGQENLSGGLIENIPISIPVNPKEQQKIASCLSSIHELINIQSQKVEALKLHKKGLLQGLFPDVNTPNMG